MSLTLAELRTLCKQRADMERSFFIKDPEWNQYINDSLAELHDLMITLYEDYFITESPVTITVAQNGTYALPADFYKMRGVDMRLGAQAQYFTVDKFNFNERNKYQNDTALGSIIGPSVRYRVVGNNIIFSPVPQGASQFRLWYIPTTAKLVNDTDTLDTYNAYHEYVVIDTALKARIKEESDIAELAAQKAAIIKRIEDSAINRDADKSETVQDVYAEVDYFYTLRRGV
jgi:hypothetical protein